MSQEQPSSKRNRLRILHLEDDSSDALLVSEVLKQEGVECDITVVSTHQEFEKCLAQGDVDLVMADYKLPTIQGDEALTLVRNKWPDMPFIFVSGSIGEERATEVVKLGATDYVMKERLRRLGGSIHRAIEEAEERAQRRAAEEQLQKKQEFLSDLFTSVQDGIVVLNDKLEVVRANPTVERLFPALLPFAGKSWGEFFDTCVSPNTDCAARVTLRTGKAEQSYQKCKTSRGILDFNIFAFPLIERRTGNRTGVILSLRDVTRELTLHRQLIQSQKMECIGQLAGSVAHDFNNILQSIILASELLSTSIHEQDPRYAEVDEIRKTAQRAVSLTRQLMTFSRQDAMSPTSIDLNNLARNMGKMLNRLMTGGIIIEFNLDPNLARVKCDGGRIEQVILNLVINSRDAMLQGGQILITSLNRTVTQEEADTGGLEWQPGQYACLAIRDTGVGIAPEIMPHLFEPFYTTKAAGKGTGLGLPTVYGIVKQHGGWIDVTSKIGEGTTFTLFLPALATEES